MFVVVLAAGSITYLDTTQSLQDQISNLQSQINSGRTTSVGPQTTGQQSSTMGQMAPSMRRITLIAEPATITIATNVTYDAWTFNGTVPAPTIMVNQGDTINFTLINNFTDMVHSIDFHAAEVNWATDYATVPPGGSKSFTFTVNYPGVFMYHCGAQPVLEHISNGMYGAIIVNPITPLPQATGGSYVLVQSEFYLTSTPVGGSYNGNYSKMLAATPDYVVFNGRAFQYQKAPLPVQPNQLVRLYILNVGPSHWSAFHVIGALMDTVYIDGDPANLEHGLQTLNIPPSGGAIVDMYFRDPGGKNPFVTHDFADAMKGAIGVFVVGSGSSTSTTSATSATSTTSTAPAAGTVRVTIPMGAGTDTSSPGYSPDTITVVVGVNNTVVWTNNDNMPHTVTSTTKLFDSGNMNPGDTFSYTFTSPGTYSYSCSYHYWMKGTVIVKGG